jgi:HAD superfamily hydrolase (TIGR01457 family)
MEDRLKTIKCFLLDMDGTFYLGNQLIKGSLEFLGILEKEGREFIFLTNNSSKSSCHYQEKLKKMGCLVKQERIFTSGEATTIHINSLTKNAKVFLLGNEFLEKEFIDSGINIVHDKNEVVDYVVVGFDTTLTYKKLWDACDLIRNGVPYIATHPDLNCPLEGEQFMPDAGAIIEFIAASTGVRPYVVGKPNAALIDSICTRYNLKKNEIAIVGDRMYTDILTGVNANIPSILVLTGETGLEDVKISEIQPDYIFQSLLDLGKVIT